MILLYIIQRVCLSESFTAVMGRKNRVIYFQLAALLHALPCIWLCSVVRDVANLFFDTQGHSIVQACTCQRQDRSDAGAADDAGLLADTSWQCIPKTHMAQVLVNFVFANLASHALTKATRAGGEKGIQDLALGLNRVVSEVVCLISAGYTFEWPVNKYVMVILLSKGVKDVAQLLIRTLHLCKVFGNIYADERALIGDKDCILHWTHAGRAVIGQAEYRMSLESCPRAAPSHGAR